jgi:hypothetical protein
MAGYRTHEEPVPERDDVSAASEGDYAEEYSAEHYDDGRTVRSWRGVDVAGRVNSVLFALLVALETLLGLRFALLAFGANLSNGFVDFIMDVSWPFVRPFDGAFANRTWDEGVIEVNTLLAMGVWLLLFAIIMMLVSALLPRWTESYRERPLRRRRIEHHG